MSFSSRPSKRVRSFLMSCGSNSEWRSRGTSICTWPRLPRRVFGMVPLRELPKIPSVPWFTALLCRRLAGLAFYFFGINEPRPSQIVSAFVREVTEEDDIDRHAIAVCQIVDNPLCAWVKFRRNHNQFVALVKFLRWVYPERIVKPLFQFPTRILF